MLSAWRITKKKHAASAFNGEGARLFGGRWNTPGIAIIYTAQSRALAALEILVHLDSPELLNSYLLFEVGIDESFIQNLPEPSLPKNWRSDPPPPEAQALGDIWVTSSSSAILRVPSSIVPGEFNYLINPAHPDFSHLRLGKPISFPLDPRLVKR